jgi:adenylate kinase
MSTITSLLPPYRGRYRTLLLFGPPGSGKGTVGKVLSNAGNHVHLSSGDIFRGLAPESPAGQLTQAFVSKGHLVPDEATIAIWHNYVDGLIATNKFFPASQLLILDGIPRTVKQAELMDPYLDLAKLLVLEMPNIEGLIARLKKRAQIEKRADDTNEEVLRTRMEIYERDTAKLLHHYPKEKIVRIQADQRPIEVLRDTLAALGDIL